MTRAGRQTLDPCINEGGNSIGVAPYIAQLVNNISIEGEAAKNAAPNYIAYVMATTGGIAYIRDVNEWAPFTAADPHTRGGIPLKARIFSEETGLYSNPLSTTDGNVCIFPANPDFYPLSRKIKEAVMSINCVEDNISQNLDNLREMAIIITRDSKLKNQLIMLNRMRQSGKAAYGVLSIPKDGNTETVTDLLTREDLDNLATILNFSTNAHNYLADYLALKQDYRQELQNIIGVTEVAEKTERRINAEMEMIENSSFAMVDLIINNINNYAKFYGVDVHAHRTHSGCAQHVDNAIQNEQIEEVSDNVSGGDEQ